MYYKITTKKWFQKTYGNTYHSCRVEKCDCIGHDFKCEEIGYIPFRYGYGDHYLNTAAEILGITEAELRQDMRDSQDKYCVFANDVNRKRDL